jgi:GTP pyrophosphokinase
MSFAKFNSEDKLLIKNAWEKLEVSARRRCRFDKEIEVVKSAYEFASNAHKDIRRRSGEPYILHPIAVAQIVVDDIGLGYKSISAALLHDVVEDTDYTVEDIRHQFGDKIATLVEGLTKIKTVLDNEDRRGGTTIESIQAENLKRILLTLNDDVRVVLIKLADRLHNCRTIEFMPEHKRDKVLSETMFIFIPLAHRLGLYGIKSEMENIWLRYKEPEAYKDISNRIDRNVALRDKEIDAFICPIESALKQADISFEIKKRLKTPYSIWFKMNTKKIPFDQIYDLYAVRIIYDQSSGSAEAEKMEAFRIFSILTGIYGQQPDRYRDWINNPKSNGYEALHCTLMSRSGFWIEVQIRSRRMDDIAERGIAAHWAYKRDGYLNDSESNMDKWLAKVQEILSSEDVNALELLDIIHKDLIATDIVVFTPKGEQKSIQAGATVLDFAYMIHTDIGNTAIAAKVNMRLVPLSQELKTGDQVEIISAKSGRPKLEWLQFLQTRHARNVVLEYFRGERDTLIKNGETIYNERLKAMNYPNNLDTLKQLLDYSQLNYQPELFFRIGAGVIGPNDFRNALLGRSSKSISHGNYVVADCCNPIPGDPIIGFKHKDGMIVVHKKSCPIAERLASKHGDQVVVVPDMDIEEREFPVRISMRGIDKLGLLNEITGCISVDMGVNITEIHLGGKDGVFEGYIAMEVRDRKVLETMIADLGKIDGISDVVRTDI